MKPSDTFQLKPEHHKAIEDLAGRYQAQRLAFREASENLGIAHMQLFDAIRKTHPELEKCSFSLNKDGKSVNIET